LSELEKTSVEDVYDAIGRSELGVDDVLDTVFKGRKREPGGKIASKSKGKTARPSVVIEGLEPGVAVHMSKCCWPLPGERIIGLRRRGDIGVHAASCSVLAAYEDELARWHDLRWAPDAAQRPASLARIAVWMANEPGVLGRVCTLIGEQRANIDNFAVVDRQPEVYRITLDLEVRDLRHLSDLLTALEAQVFVRRAERKRDLPETTANPQPRLPLAPTDGRAVPASLETRAPADPAGAAVSAPAGRGTKSGAAASPARD
ncbi:MAG: ACT domain-containing protein, partial [Pseudomonadota bacterium]